MSVGSRAALYNAPLCGEIRADGSWGRRGAVEMCSPTPVPKRPFVMPTDPIRKVPRLGIEVDY